MKASEELEQRKIYNCPECKCALGDDWNYLDFSNKNIIVCPQCKHQIHSNEEEYVSIECKKCGIEFHSYDKDFKGIPEHECLEAN